MRSATTKKTSAVRAALHVLLVCVVFSCAGPPGQTEKKEVKETGPGKAEAGGKGTKGGEPQAGKTEKETNAEKVEIGRGAAADSGKETITELPVEPPADEKTGILKDLSLSANSTFNTKYVWRGLAVDDQPVWQPDFTVGYGPVSFNWWGNMELTRWGERAGYGNQRGEFTEIDYTVDVSIPVSFVNFSGGYVAYTFPHTGFDSTTELYTGVGLDCFLNPKFAIYFDVDEAKGRYGKLSFGHEMELFKIGEDVAVGLSGSISGAYGSREFNDFYYGVGKSCLVDLQIDGGLPITIGKYLTVTPGIHWSKVLNPALREGPTRNDTGWVGITTGLSF